jgi:hypothetical protein
MGGQWIFGLVFLVIMGCTRADRPESSSPPVVEREIIHEQCPPAPEPVKCEGVADLIEIKNKCFKAVELRESTIEELRRQAITLQEEIVAAKAEATDWRERYNNQQTNSNHYYDGY